MTTTLVTGLVRVGPEVDVALSRLMALGYRQDEVSLVMSDVTRRMHFVIEPGAQAAVTKGAARGAAVGKAVGAVVSAILLVGTSFLLPDVGLVIAGPLATSMMGLGAGAGADVLTTLAAIGVAEPAARLYELGLAHGKIIVGVPARAPGDATAVAQIFRDLEASEVESVSTPRIAPSPSP